MATIITVHGTFAHFPIASGEASDGSGAYWWQPGSAFARNMQAFVEGDDGALTVRNFAWSGDNSERERRAAGSALLNVFRELEAKGEKYCVVGHSHGGSVISSALLESVSRNIALDGLQRWITVGTPFVSLRKERFLFLRLPLILKAMFVASLMLLFMFLFYVTGEIFLGRRDLSNTGQLIRLGISGALTTLPFLVFYAIAKIMDSRELWFYRRNVIERARERFGDKWLALSHEDDEAVQGLSSLNAVRFNIFHRTFAVSVLSVASVSLLPLAYLYLVFSPSLMTGLADYLKNNVYQIAEFERVEDSYRADRRELRGLRKKIRRLQAEADRPAVDAGKAMELRATIKGLRQELRKARDEMRARYKDAMQVHRAARFKNRFLSINGRPCTGNQLCYGGRDIVLNSSLLFHLVTDELASWFFDSDVRYSSLTRIVLFAIPVLLVPVVFGLLAIAMVLLVQFLASYVSQFASRVLDNMTWFEVRRSALGNDTESEVALAALRHPPWLEKVPKFLPAELADVITQKSNAAMSASLGKIRSAISDLAFAEGHEDKTATVLAYLNWQELIHMAYFQVPEFRKLVAMAISEADGFKPTQALLRDPQTQVVDGWLNVLRPSRAELA